METCRCGRTFDPRWPGNATARVCPVCAERKGIETDPEARRSREAEVLADPLVRAILAKCRRGSAPAAQFPDDPF